MTMVWVVLGVVAVLVVVTVGYVGWRDRQRAKVADDDVAERSALSRKHRYEIERHASQGTAWNRGGHGPTG
ncbi:hypothetical protein JNW88_24340 [Micromonospora sp. ATA32]|nr:hypothetical protein [Micromonospora sp. ATA32]